MDLVAAELLLLPRARSAWFIALTTDIGSRRILFPAQQTLPQARSIHSYRFTNIAKGKRPFRIILEDPSLRIQKFIRGFASRLKLIILEAFDRVLQDSNHKSFFRLQIAITISVGAINSNTMSVHDSRTYRMAPNIVKIPTSFLS